MAQRPFTEAVDVVPCQIMVEGVLFDEELPVAVKAVADTAAVNEVRGTAFRRGMIVLQLQEPNSGLVALREGV